LGRRIGKQKTAKKRERISFTGGILENNTI
jgi:hypothetical protein